MKIPIIRVIVDSGDWISKEDDPTAKRRGMSLTQKLQTLLKRQGLNDKRFK